MERLDTVKEDQTLINKSKTVRSSKNRIYLNEKNEKAKIDDGFEQMVKRFALNTSGSKPQKRSVSIKDHKTIKNESVAAVKKVLST